MKKTSAPADPEDTRKKRREYYREYRKKRRAYYLAIDAVHVAVRRGKRLLSGKLDPSKCCGRIILMPPFCPWCGNRAKTENHHYAEKLWLRTRMHVIQCCKPCHRDIHKRMKTNESTGKAPFQGFIDFIRAAFKAHPRGENHEKTQDT